MPIDPKTFRDGMPGVDPTERIYFHRNLGECTIDELCMEMNRTNPDKTSIFVVHDNDIKEVTKALVKDAEGNPLP